MLAFALSCTQTTPAPVDEPPTSLPDEHGIDPLDMLTDGDEAAPYPRPGAPVPAYPPTPQPRPIPAVGTIVGIWEVGAAPSRDSTAVRHALATMGIPSESIARPSQLPAYRVVVVVGELTDATITKDAADRLAAALQAGTAVLLVAPRATRLYALAGIQAVAPMGDRRELLLADEPSPLLEELRSIAISKLPLTGAGAVTPTVGYAVQDGGARVLARFDDGSAALVQRGALYVLGLRTQYYLDLLSGLGLGFSDEYTNRHYIQGDLLPLLLRRFYLLHAPSPRVRRTAPDGHRAAVILTHDCDSPYSAQIMHHFAEAERARGVRATYLVTTSAYRNGLMGAVYTRAMIHGLRRLVADGFDVGSHSFGHFPDFHRLPVALDGESAANYLPRYDQGQTQGGSLVGEIQVSRYLLEEDLGIRVAAFRPGFLLTPPAYYEQLVAGGYLRSSVRAGGLVRTNFPHRAVRSRPGGYDIYPVIEYPLALSDRGLDEGNIPERVAQWLAVVDRNLVTGAPTLLLVHPSRRPGRTQALVAFLDALQGRDVWVGDLSRFAAFYEEQGF
ncbi:MAG: hypothetical protein RMK29_09660 [Myxococcales bacterium]|nr:hypothetical protein [Myxococcota bacterium]MDW8281967.1 hypothetical protein [Myxococcales bacterium]